MELTETYDQLLLAESDLLEIFRMTKEQSPLHEQIVKLDEAAVRLDESKKSIQKLRAKMLEGIHEPEKEEADQELEPIG